MKNKISPGERLKATRIGLGFATAADAARRFGWNRYTYSNHENENSELSRKAAEKYARKFKVSPGYLLWGEDKNATASREDAKDSENTHTQSVAYRKIPRLKWGVFSSLGSLDMAIAQANEFTTVSSSLARAGVMFSLPMPDDSMQGAGARESVFQGDEIKFAEYCEGDIIKPGQLVLAILEDNTEVFRKYTLSGRTEDNHDIVKLVPLNDAYRTETIIPAQGKGRILAICTSFERGAP